MRLSRPIDIGNPQPYMSSRNVDSELWTSEPYARWPQTTLDLLQGTLDLLVLKTLSWGPAHGYAIARWTQQLTGDAFKLGQGSLYPALYRLEERGWIESEWRLSDTNRRTKVYRLTPVGRAQLKAETAAWTQFVEAMGKILRTTSQPA